MARPRIDIDAKQFEKLCGLQCPLWEIAAWFNCSEDTIERFCKREYSMSFADAYKRHSSSGKISLRRIQFKQAEKNPSMAIWLGKQWLGQKEQMVMTANINPETVKEIEDIVLNDEGTGTELSTESPS